MGIIVKNGNVNIHNYVESGAKVENKYYGTVYQGGQASDAEQEKDESVTMQTILQRIIPMVCSTRMWFAVYKGLLEAEKTRNRDYAGFKNMIEDCCEMELPYSISTSELSDLDCLSFSKPIDEWDITEAPIKRAKEFYAYKELAETTRKLAMNLG